MDVFKSIWEATLRALPLAVKSAAEAIRGKGYTISSLNAKKNIKKVTSHVQARIDRLRSGKHK